MDFAQSPDSSTLGEITPYKTPLRADPSDCMKNLSVVKLEKNNHVQAYVHAGRWEKNILLFFIKILYHPCIQDPRKPEKVREQVRKCPKMEDTMDRETIFGIRLLYTKS